MRNVLCVASLVAAVALPLSANDKIKDSEKHPDQMQQTGSADSRKLSQTSSVRAVRLSQLLEAEVTSKDGEDLGAVEDIIVDPASGKIQYAVLGQGGIFGVGEDYVPVPWNAINLQSERSFTVNIDQERLKSAPKLRKDYSNLNDPNYSVTIYRFFAVPAGIGGSESPDGSQQGGGSSPGFGSQTQTNK